MTSYKRDRMTLAFCTRRALKMCSAGGVPATASTKKTNRAGFYAVTSVKPAGDAQQVDLFMAIGVSGRLSQVEGQMKTNTFGQGVKIWWRA